MGENQFRILLLTSVVILFCLSYLTYLIISLVFMRINKKKINVMLNKIKVILYQKTDSLTKILNVFYKNEIIDLDKFNSLVNMLNQKFKDLSIDEIKEKYESEEEVYKEIKKISQYLKINSVTFECQKILHNIDFLNEKYYQNIQLYNTIIIGYNYWRNLLFTKWIKILLRIEEYKSIS
ncbi:MAG: hypothetical protein ACTTID_00545 [Bacillales bacterium]